MKKILLASVALFGFAGAASAADLPVRAAPPVAPIIAAAPIFTWSGFYAGVNAGYGWVTSDRIVDPTFGFVGDDEDGGFVGGGQIGYNYQIGSFVVGLETDIQYADLGKKFRYVDAVVGYEEDDSDDWFGTVRARAGVAFDRALIYGTGGFAYGGNSDGGWTAGGGVEYAFTDNLSAKVEGLYVNLNHDDRLGPGATGGGDSEFGVARAGLNFRFSTY